MASSSSTTSNILCRYLSLLEYILDFIIDILLTIVVAMVIIAYSRIIVHHLSRTVCVAFIYKVHVYTELVVGESIIKIC